MAFEGVSQSDVRGDIIHGKDIKARLFEPYWKEEMVSALRRIYEERGDVIFEDESFQDLYAGDLVGADIDEKLELLAYHCFVAGTYTGDFVKGFPNGLAGDVASIFTNLGANEEGRKYAEGVGVSFGDDGTADIGRLKVFDEDGVWSNMDGRVMLEQILAGGPADDSVKEFRLRALKVCTVEKLLDAAENYDEWKRAFFKFFVKDKAFRLHLTHPAVFCVGLKKAETVEDKLNTLNMMCEYNVSVNKGVYTAIFENFSTYRQCMGVYDAVNEEEGLLKSRFNTPEFYYAWMRKVDQFEGDGGIEADSKDGVDEVDIHVTGKMDVMIKCAQAGLDCDDEMGVLLLANTSDEDFDFVLNLIVDEGVLSYNVLMNTGFIRELVLQADSDPKRWSVFNLMVRLPHPDYADKPKDEQRPFIPGEAFVKFLFASSDSVVGARGYMPFFRFAYSKYYENDCRGDVPDEVFNTLVKIGILGAENLTLLVGWLAESKGVVMDDAFLVTCRGCHSVDVLLKKLGVERGEDYPLSKDQEKALNETAYELKEEGDVGPQSLVLGSTQDDFMGSLSSFGGGGVANDASPADKILASMQEAIDAGDGDKPVDLGAIAKKVVGSGEGSGGQGKSKPKKPKLVKKKSDSGLLASARDVLVAVTSFEEAGISMPGNLVDNFEITPLLGFLISDALKRGVPYAAAKVKPLSDYLDFRCGRQTTYDDLLLRFVGKFREGLIYMTKSYDDLAECDHAEDVIVLVEKMLDDKVEPSDEVVEAVCSLITRGRVSPTDLTKRLEEFFAQGEVVETLDVRGMYQLYKVGVPFDVGENWLKFYGEAYERCPFSVGKADGYIHLMEVLLDDRIEVARLDAEGEESWETGMDPVTFTDGFGFNGRQWVSARNKFVELCEAKGYDVGSAEIRPVVELLEQRAAKFDKSARGSGGKERKADVFMDRVTAAWGDEGERDALVAAVGMLKGTQIKKAMNGVTRFLTEHGHNVDAPEKTGLDKFWADFYAHLRVLASEVKGKKRGKNGGNGNGPVRRKGK